MTCFACYFPKDQTENVLWVKGFYKHKVFFISVRPNYNRKSINNRLINTVFTTPCIFSICVLECYNRYILYLKWPHISNMVSFFIFQRFTMINIAGVISVILFYLLILGVGMWASRKQSGVEGIDQEVTIISIFRVAFLH